MRRIQLANRGIAPILVAVALAAAGLGLFGVVVAGVRTFVSHADGTDPTANNTTAPGCGNSTARPPPPPPPPLPPPPCGNGTGANHTGTNNSAPNGCGNGTVPPPPPPPPPPGCGSATGSGGCGNTTAAPSAHPS